MLLREPYYVPTRCFFTNFVTYQHNISQHDVSKLLVCADLKESWKNIDGCDSSEIDATIALDHMMMEAWECGIGSTWARGFDERVMRDAFDLPETWKVVSMIPMGYPAENAKPSSWHFVRKASEDLYRFI